MPMYRLNYEDIYNGMIGVDDEKSYKLAIDTVSNIHGLDKLIIHVIVQDEASVRESIALF